MSEGMSEWSPDHLDAIGAANEIAVGSPLGRNEVEDAVVDSRAATIRLTPRGLS